MSDKISAETTSLHTENQRSTEASNATTKTGAVQEMPQTVVQTQAAATETQSSTDTGTGTQIKKVDEGVVLSFSIRLRGGKFSEGNTPL